MISYYLLQETKQQTSPHTNTRGDLPGTGRGQLMIFIASVNDMQEHIHVHMRTSAVDPANIQTSSIVLRAISGLME